jgi:hypothetical protein
MKRPLIAILLVSVLSACSSLSSDEQPNQVTLKIRAAIVYKMGGPQPVARTTFYLTKESLVSLLRKSGKSEDIGVFAALVNYETQLEGRSKAFDNLVKPIAVATATTGFEGNASFKDLSPVTYFLIGVTQTRSGVAIWNTPVTPGDETVLVDQSNAAYTS